MGIIQEWQKQLVPELMDVMKRRYSILHHIMMSGHIGRRALAASLNMTERVLRSEVEFLKSQGFIDVSSAGMSVTDAGKILLDQMDDAVKDLFGLAEYEEKIRKAFGLKEVVVVPGDSSQFPLRKKELGQAGASIVRKAVRPGDVIAVAGGSTMAEIANHLTPSSQMKNNWFVPARGGLGETVELQSNTIASTMAKRTGAQYRLLHVPDHLGEEAYQSLMQEPNIQEIISVIRRARIIVHGIGDAIEMAKRRKVDEETIQQLQEAGALAEAFGYYFNQDGEVVRNIPTVGLRLKDIQNTELVIGVAGGRNKGHAIAAVLRFGHEDILVTDEAAAEEILKLI